MNKIFVPHAVLAGVKKNLSATRLAMAFAFFLFFSNVVFAAPSFGADIPADQICGFLGNINNLLNISSIVVVSLAAVISGFRLALTYDRIADVAPILIGGLLIATTTQIASMLIDKDACSTKAAATEGAVQVEAS